MLLHAQALMKGASDYIDADARDTEAILTAAAQTLDFSQPVAVMLIAILHLIGDEDNPRALVVKLMGAMPPGSYLALSHVASDIEAENMAEMGKRLNRLLSQKGTYRSHAGVMRFFDGLELVEPGVVPVPQWRPDTDIEAQTPAAMWSGVGRKA